VLLRIAYNVAKMLYANIILRLEGPWKCIIRVPANPGIGVFRLRKLESPGK